MDDKELRLLLGEFLRKQKPQFVFHMVQKKYNVTREQFGRVSISLMSDEFKHNKNILNDLTSFLMKYQLLG